MYLTFVKLHGRLKSAGLKGSRGRASVNAVIEFWKRRVVPMPVFLRLRARVRCSVSGRWKHNKRGLVLEASLLSVRTSVDRKRNAWKSASCCPPSCSQLDRSCGASHSLTITRSHRGSRLCDTNCKGLFKSLAGKQHFCLVRHCLTQSALNAHFVFLQSSVCLWLSVGVLQPPSPKILFR